MQNYLLGCIQKYKVVENGLPWISVPNDERQQKQGSRAKHSWVTCTYEFSSVLTIDVRTPFFYI